MGSAAAQAFVQRGRAVGGELRLELVPQLGVGARKFELLQSGAYVQPRAADQNRHLAACPQLSTVSARATRWYSATLAVWVTSQMSRTWWGTPSRSGTGAWRCRCPCRGKAASSRR